MLKGGFNFGPQEQPEGTVGYFTEGTEYEQSCDSYPTLRLSPLLFLSQIDSVKLH